MKTLLVICALAAFFLSSDAVIRQKYVCENSILYISCPLNYKIKVMCSIYGRTVPRTQRCSTTPIRYQDTTCIAQSSVSKVRQYCEGKRSCSVRASNSVFGDPCVGTRKYLDVCYDCVKKC
ncbi:L-rhamnose-binding lectin ELEL-1-like [Anneissia japonica]|uniref:L-rhamnose-binding lectin ELEL-1-like n=1 Tax=Anneissia japonica TaxID=1529436 RepID=UPI001425B109|nr:L-rhamnose-binding lectin ELEL-1-like [Anneissia japonica]